MSDLINKYLNEKIEELKSNNYHPKNFKNIRDIKASIVSATIMNKAENLERYLKFQEIVKRERDAGQPYFRMSHIDELGLPYDLLIFVSEKNIGKSREMLSHMNRAYKSDKKFVLMRTMDVHIDTGLSMQLSENHSQFFIYGTKKEIFHKVDKDWNTGKAKRAGLAMSLNTCIKFKGGSFDGYEWLWFDEATDKHEDINVNSFRKLFISVVNSIERKKDDFKIIITGNTDFDVSHPLFEYLEIDPTQQLCYITRHNPGADKPTRILFINSKGLYGGANTSRFIGAGGDPKSALDAFMNNTTNSTDRVIAHDLTFLADPSLCLIFKDSMGKKWQLTLAKHNFTKQIDGITYIEDKTETWYYLKIEDFQPAYLYGYTCYTDDITIHGLYKSFVHYKKNLSNEWLRIKRIVKSGKCILIKEQTELILHKNLERMTAKAEVLLG